MRITGSVAFITGGARGLGRGFTELLLGAGGKVCLADVNETRGRETEQELKQEYGDRVMFVRCNVADENSFKEALEKTVNHFGSLDILVNNAGVFDIPNYELLVNINLTGVIRGCQLGLEYLSKARSGRGGLIVNIGSTGGITPFGYNPVYAATKYGVVGFSRSLQLHLDESGEDHGIRITCLCPSFTETEMLTTYERNIKKDDITAATNTEMMKNLGLMRVSDVVKGFHELVVNDGNKGGVLVVTPKGLHYKYPRSLKSRL